MTEKEKLIVNIFRAILVHMNGYDRADLTDDVVLENQGHELWDEIEDLINEKTH